jgi:hypothetical protein
MVPVYMNGAAVVRQLGMGPLGDRMGLFIAVTSYNNILSINPTSCRRTMPDIDFFIQCIKDSHQDLIDATNNAKAKKATKPIKGKQASSSVTTIKKRSSSKKKTTTKKTNAKKVSAKKVSAKGL